MKFLALFLVIFIFGCKSYKNNYEFIIGKWQFHDMKIYDPEKIILKNSQDSLQFVKKKQEMMNLISEFKNDSTVVDPTSKTNSKFTFLEVTPPVIYDYKTDDGTLILDDRNIIFKIVDDNTMELGYSYYNNKVLTILTYKRIK